jgi:hypothetical protein
MMAASSAAKKQAPDSLGLVFLGHIEKTALGILF